MIHVITVLVIFFEYTFFISYDVLRVNTFVKRLNFDNYSINTLTVVPIVVGIDRKSPSARNRCGPVVSTRISSNDGHLLYGTVVVLEEVVSGGFRSGLGGTTTRLKPLDRPTVFVFRPLERGGPPDGDHRRRPEDGVVRGAPGPGRRLYGVRRRHGLSPADIRGNGNVETSAKNRTNSPF